MLIKKLYGQSARKFVIIGLGPLGCIPSQRTKGACNANLSNMVVDFNAALEEVVKAMGSQFSNMKITFANPHPVIEDFLNNPSNYGMESMYFSVGVIVGFLNNLSSVRF